MTTSTLTPPVTAPGAAPRRRFRITGASLMFGYTWLVILWLVLPIFVMILFGFNNPHGKFNQTWQGFTVKWYKDIFGLDELTSALWLSLVIAVISSLLAAAVGTGIGYALGRYQFRGSGTINLLLFATMASPELIMGASLLSLFVSLNTGRGVATIVIGHVLFSISFVTTVVRARVITLDRSIEEAAADLGATAWTTFWKVTFPILLPAIFSGFMLAFALSIDDFVVTNFVSGSATTFPLYIWGATRVGLPPQVNVMGTLIFAAGVLIAVIANLRSRSTSKRD
ncbi:ABC transporter permease [Actinoplanes sp. SE50]|uniref:ABC transporter permease n=1 Tax=unclassified Actinoplanes TaxID=2626549 RepID=UPI00023ED3F7|nr:MULTISPECIES: ABC transporter permease [unclassified Actinoplanes]AEV83363.1 Spermidine/putrescine transport system permease protein potC [Actinoplanes sp. SE50/110]ATO81756.1 ABC transporter permease [Actinoplanes sp. SE50]SLL99164.1 ABC transporter permease [Actinoplanes sp. SE50/110]